MDITGIGAVADLATTVVSKIWPDKSAEEQQQLAASLALIQGQMAINQVEAASPSLFVSGWRPGAGWVCVVTLALTFIPKAIVLTVMWCIHCWATIHAGDIGLPPYPDMGITDVFGLLGALLGIGGMRTVEKLKGVGAK